MDKKITAKFIYDGKPDDSTDAQIKKVAKSAGMVWYAQGYNFETNQRDVCFDLKKEEI